MNKQTYIEVNGKRYDALTGKLIGHTVSDGSAAAKKTDGFSRPRNDIFRPSLSKQRKLQKSQTLMRGALKKPEIKRAPTHEEAKSVKSPLISKFGGPAPKTLTRLEPVMVAHPKEDLELLRKHADTQSLSLTNSHSKSNSLVEQAMQKSESHHMPRHAVARRKKLSHKLGISSRVARAGSLMAAFVMLGTFFAYQNVPNFAMRVASSRAGFSAKMPGYHPSGFGFRGPVQYKSGEVVVRFGSNTSDGREFALTQRTSNWNNDALLANFVLSNDSRYQTYQENDKTIYIYDQSNATWVDEGVWYQLEGNAALTTDQISKLASSL
ncbi:MAG: hypothetical protein M3Q79_02175 [bacterium]|nr:hypothetical protein [bacterium]